MSADPVGLADYGPQPAPLYGVIGAHRDEARLTQAAIDGDQEAYWTLIRHYWKPAFMVAFNRLHNSDEATEAVDACALRGTESIRYVAFRGMLFFRRWFFVMVRNKALDVWRRRKFVAVEGPHEEGVYFLSDKLVRLHLDDTTPDDVLRAERVTLMRALIAGLPEEDRHLIHLFYGLELPVATICQRVGLGRQCIKSRLFRLRQKLRAMILADERLAEVLAS